ncbi:uncharacterized protein LOC127704228 [Mytilus californianus]|uniref:uncharacterized protein LOC127704228 n=1 Tax=Mytilus californianus TaxID=6549 RepID=UPI00224773BC|nr:uncharacterized protein LOC127704228 [Mytilus californianus]
MEYYRNFEKHRETIERTITHEGVPEIARRMHENNIITGEEKFQIINLTTQKRVKKLLDVVKEKCCFMKFIGILYTCGFKECAQLVEGNAVVSIQEEIEPINAQMESDLQEARQNIRQLQCFNDRLQREREALNLRIREQANSLKLMHRKDEIYAEKCKELNQTKKELKRIEERIATIDSRDLVRENTLLQEDIAASKAQVQSLEEKTDVMRIQSIRMEQKVDGLNNKVDTLINLVSGQAIIPSGTSYAPITLESELTLVGSETSSTPVPIMLESEPTLVMSERSSRYVPRPGISAAQVVKLPPIKRST